MALQGFIDLWHII